MVHWWGCQLFLYSFFGFINLTDEISLIIAVLFSKYVSFYLNTCLQFIAAHSAHWYLNNISSSPLACIVTSTILSITLVCHTQQCSCWWSSHVECIAQYWHYSHGSENQKGKWGKIQITYVCYFFSVANIQGCLDRLFTLCNSELCPPSQNAYKCFIYFFTVV